jgi:hypothetical protein
VLNRSPALGTGWAKDDSLENELKNQQHLESVDSHKKSQKKPKVSLVKRVWNNVKIYKGPIFATVGCLAAIGLGYCYRENFYDFIANALSFGGPKPKIITMDDPFFGSMKVYKTTRDALRALDDLNELEKNHVAIVDFHNEMLAFTNKLISSNNDIQDRFKLIQKVKDRPGYDKLSKKAEDLDKHANNLRASGMKSRFDEQLWYLSPKTQQFHVVVPGGARSK